MSKTANKGEWSEIYAALRILGEGKLYMANAEGNKDPDEWMDVQELIRCEATNRMVTYSTDKENSHIDIAVNNIHKTSVAASEFSLMADRLGEEIRMGKGRAFTISSELEEFLSKVEIENTKAKSVDKSDIFLSARDPRSSVIRKNIGFSVKSEFGQNPTLFNTAKASAVVYKVHGMNDDLMEKINSLYDSKNHVAVSDRCEALKRNCYSLEFVGFPVVSRSKEKVAAFKENLDMINPRLPRVIECMLWDHFFEGETKTDLDIVTRRVAEKNPCKVSRPEEKYEYMIKAFIYAAYCGMTASKLWDGNSKVNGGFIKIDGEGEVAAHYALESDAFKSYLFKNCYLEFPSTDEGHGNYAKVYKEGDEYYFRLNFQIRYK